jgi:hypothetical protein
MWEHGFTYWVLGFSRVSESHDCQDYHGWTRDSVPIKASLDCIWNVGIGIVNISLYHSGTVPYDRQRRRRPGPELILPHGLAKPIVYHGLRWCVESCLAKKTLGAGLQV